MQEITTPYGRLVFNEGIQYVYINEQIELTPEMLEHIHSIGKRMSGGKKYAILADIHREVTSTPEARVYGARNEFMGNHLAYALLAKSVPVKLMANLFIHFNKPTVSSRMFTREEDAITWLKQYVASVSALK